MVNRVRNRVGGAHGTPHRAWLRLICGIGGGLTRASALFALCLSLASLALVSLPSSAATPVWEQVSSGEARVQLGNPVRNRRTNEATVAVAVANLSGKVLEGPLRLVVAGLTPAAKVSVGGAAGLTAANEPYVTLGSSLAAGGSATANLLILGGGTNLFGLTPRLERQVAVPLSIQISSPASLLTVGSTPITVRGTVSDPAAAVTLNGAPVSNANGSFQADVALQEGHNSITARAVDAQGSDVTAAIAVSLDMTPPYITVESPRDGDTVRIDKIAVSGLVNDIVRGTVADGQANVTVNGRTAGVSNRSYLAQDVLLAPGENTIRVDASDNVGNSASLSIKVNYSPLAAQHIELRSGQDQSAQIGATVDQPLKVKLVDGQGQPVPDKPVIYRVTQGDGVVGVGSADAGQGTLVRTDAEGIAATPFKVGTRAGTGNQRVRAAAVGFDGEVLFYASATVGTGDKVTVNSGNNQRGAVGQPLPLPFVVAVVDVGANVVPGAQIEFAVTQGSGKFRNGQTSILSTTDSDGRATAELTLGAEEGLDVHRATATLVGTSLYAGFTASALKTGAPGQTSISGVVLDNQDNPLPEVTVRVDGSTREARTDAQGQFKITEVPVGSLRLVADGSTTTAEGEWPTLAFNLVTIAGADNPLAAPIYLVKLDTVNAKLVGAQDVTITLPEVPGFALEVKAGSVTFPDGKKTGQLSVTPVNASKIPMAPPNGMQPQFIVTIQPVGARFDPPAPLTLPNVDGHAPGAEVEMYSYDHDLEEFVAIGLGTVSTDGSVIKSNPGVGVIKAGWHCGSLPGGAGCAHNCPICMDCDARCICVPKKVTIGEPTAKVNGEDEVIVPLESGKATADFLGDASANNCDIQYAWDFGDNEKAESQAPSHMYTKEGNYTVKLTVKCKECSSEKKTKSLTVSVVKISLKEVSFSGASYHEITKDSGSSAYGSPHWQDNSLPPDGDADDPDDRKYPVAYTRNTKMSLGAKFELDPAPTVASTSVKIKATGIGLEIPETAGSIGGSTVNLAATATTSSLPDQIDIFDPAEFTWQLSFDRGAKWVDAGKSKNKVYVLLANPVAGMTVFHTLARIGSLNGKSKTDKKKATIDAIFEEFRDRVVKRADDDVQMTYYNSYGSSCTGTAGLLAGGDGQCGSWAKLFIDTLKVQGIDQSSDYVTFQQDSSLSALPDSSKGFLVKEWAFAGAGISGLSAFPYLNIPNSPLISGVSYSWRYSDVTDQPGVAGQGNDNPASLFNNHQVVKINDTYYDPSYGKSFASLQEIDDQAIAGFYIRGTLAVDEPVVNLDLNGDGDKTDLGVTVSVFAVQKNPAGLNLKEDIVDY